MTVHPGPAALRVSPPSGPLTRTPGVVTAGKVLLILSAVANGLLAAFATGLAALSSRVMPTLTAGDPDAAAEGAGLDTAMVVLAVWCVLAVVLEIWAVVALRGPQRRAARVVATGRPIGDVVTGLLTAPVLGVSVVVSTVFWSLVWVALFVALWWLPADARVYFAGHGSPSWTDDATRPLMVVGRPPDVRRTTTVVVVAVAVTVLAVATIAWTLALRGWAGSAATVDQAALVSCAQSFEQEWGPGLASPSGERITVAATGLAIANGSFDSPTDIPRRVLRTAYQTQDMAGNNLTILADRHVKETMADPRFRSCSQDAAAWRGNTPRVLQAFGCVSKPSSPVLLDCS